MAGDSMEKKKNYHEQQKIDDTLHLRELLKSLPPFTEEYFRGARRLSSTKSKLAYAYDLRIFFNYLCQSHDCFLNKSNREIALRDMEEITPLDIDLFIDYVSFYENPEVKRGYLNEDRAKSRKLSAIRSFYEFFCKKEKLTNNPAKLVETPKIHDKNIVKLETDEASRLLDEVESGNKLTKRQKKYHERSKARDLAIMSLMLGTGIRVSECVGINIDDVDFSLGGVKIIRKGGNESIVYFNDEVANVLLDYLELRKQQPSGDGALFLSLQKKRINVRSVQKLVKKYAALVTTVKNITPHKLRSTYATNLYSKSQDIYLVADALGHRNVNTTTRHYARMDDERRRQASAYIKLR